MLEAVTQMFAQAWNIAHIKDAEFIKEKRKTASLAQLFGIAKLLWISRLLFDGVRLARRPNCR